MSIQVGRQIRIDEDIVGYNDEQLEALVKLTKLLLPKCLICEDRTPSGDNDYCDECAEASDRIPPDPRHRKPSPLDEDEILHLEARLEMFGEEQARRRRLQDPGDTYDEGYTGTCQSCGEYWNVIQHTNCPSCGGHLG